MSDTTTVALTLSDETSVVIPAVESTTVVATGTVGPRGPQGIQGPPGSGGSGSGLHADLTDLATSGHPAAIVAVTPTGAVAATNVQAAIAELDTEKETPAGAQAKADAAQAAAIAASQPVDSDLTAIAALSTTAYGRALLVLADAAAGRTAFGLGTASTHAHGDYDLAGAAAAAQAASQPLDSDLTAIAALSTTAFGRALLVLADAAAGRAALGLGTAATAATGDFDAAGTAAAAVAALVASAPGALDTLDELAAALGDDANFAATITTALAGKQPLDSDLTAIAALSTTSFGRSFLDRADAAAGRTLLGLGTMAVEAATSYQPVDSDLTSIAALTTTTYGRDLLTLANRAALISLLALTEGDVTGLVADLAAKIPAALVDAKGDIIAATAADTVARLAVGSNGQVLTADSGETTGIKWATPSGGGSAHVIREDGTDKTQRAGLNFVNDFDDASRIQFSLFDDAGDDETEVRAYLDGQPGHVVRENDTPQTQRGAVNFVDSATIAWSVTDDSGDEETEVSADSLVPPGHQIKDSGTPVTTNTVLDFGDGLSAIDAGAAINVDPDFAYFATALRTLIPVELGIAVGDETTAITTGTAKVTWRMPFAMTVTSVRASLTAASTSGIPTFDINEGGTTILSTKLTVDANELTSQTAAAAAVISDANLADNAEITIDIDVAGTGAKGPKVWILGTRA